MNITYTTDDPAREYANAIRRAKTVEALVEAILPYKRVADDALRVAKKMTSEDFKQFQGDLKKERSRKFTDKWIDEFNAKWGAIVMPRKLIIASLTAMRYHVPWGLAFIRCKKMGWK